MLILATLVLAAAQTTLVVTHGRIADGSGGPLVEGKDDRRPGGHDRGRRRWRRATRPRPARASSTPGEWSWPPASSTCTPMPTARSSRCRGPRRRSGRESPPSWAARTARPDGRSTSSSPRCSRRAPPSTWPPRRASGPSASRRWAPTTSGPARPDEIAADARPGRGRDAGGRLRPLERPRVRARFVLHHRRDRGGREGRRSRTAASTSATCATRALKVIDSFRELIDIADAGGDPGADQPHQAGLGQRLGEVRRVRGAREGGRRRASSASRPIATPTTTGTARCASWCSRAATTTATTWCAASTTTAGPRTSSSRATCPIPSLEGKSLAEIATAKKTDPYTLYMNMIRETDPEHRNPGLGERPRGNPRASRCARRTSARSTPIRG